MEPQSVSLRVGDRELKLEHGKFVTQGGGTISASLGDTIVLAVGSISDEPLETADFFPMVVDYEERYYAAGKIKGSRFIKREGRPSENAILRSRLIDRPLRPMFPKGYRYDVQLIASVLSADLQVDPGTIAITGASMALLAAGAPIEPVSGVRIGLLNDELIINPTYEQGEQGRLSLVVAGTEEAITMVEAAASEVDEDTILKAFELAHAEIKKMCALQKELAKKLKVAPREFTIKENNVEAVKAVDESVNIEMLDKIKGTTKAEVKKKMKEVIKNVVEKYNQQLEQGTFSKGELTELINDKLAKRMRQNILEKGERLDGREVDEIRPVSCDVGVLPKTHGTGLFRRGETHVLSVVTLGAPGDSQVIDTMDTDMEKRYIHHYNFPPYSVGEIKGLRGPSRREIGHGDLAERALIPVLPSKEEFPYTIWVVSEVLSCNGSSSMGSVCGSTLALMDAGVKIKKPVSAIAMGLVTQSGDVREGYKILTDIQGMEDFCGDMDFKVAGTTDGITALQMDIKVKGLTLEVLREALDKAKKARLSILKDMMKTIAAPRTELSPNAPLITTLRIDPDQIRAVIGKGGEMIQKITAECNVKIDIEDDGLVMITAENQESGKKALEWIQQITYVPKVGDVFDGKVTRIMEFGAFVEIVPGKEGLVHISQLAKERVNQVEDVVKEGDTLKVKLMEIDSQGRLNLSHKATLPGEENSTYTGRPSSGRTGGGRPGGRSGGGGGRRY